MQTFGEGNTFSIATDLYFPIPSSAHPAHCGVLSRLGQHSPCPECPSPAWRDRDVPRHPFPLRQVILIGPADRLYFCDNSVTLFYFTISFSLPKQYELVVKSPIVENYIKNVNSLPIFPENCTFSPRSLENDLSYFPAAYRDTSMGAHITAPQFFKSKMEL